MMEELHLEGNWWIPDRQDQKFVGTLTFDHQLERQVLTIISGIDFENSEMGNRQVKPKHDIILRETSDGQKVTLKDCERGEWYSYIARITGLFTAVIFMVSILLYMNPVSTDSIFYPFFQWVGGFFIPIMIGIVALIKGVAQVIAISSIIVAVPAGLLLL
jgi:hypothetical protein